MTRDELKQRLQQPYDRTAWLALLRELFGSAVSVLASSHTVSTGRSDGLKLIQLGNVQLSDGRNLTLLEGEVGDRVQIRKNRVAIQSWAASHIDMHCVHGALAVFRGKEVEYRFTFVAKESEFTEDGIFVERQTAPRRYTYLLGPGESCATAAQRFLQLAEKKDRSTLPDVVEAFSVEKLTREFFQDYKNHYSRFVAHLLSGELPQRVFGIPRIEDAGEQDKANKPVRDFAKRLLGRLVFLHFLQKKGWLGCPADRTDWTDGDRDFVRNLFRGCLDRERFHSTRLIPLFYGTLNDPDRARSIFSITGTRVPYLNGGLFERERMPNDHSPLPVERIDFPAALFEPLLEFFAQYNFTIDENDPDDNEIGIDPEMMGHIFENLLEDNKDKGAYYTPKAIVRFMCQQSLIQYLQKHLGENEALERLVRFKEEGPRSDRHNCVVRNARRIEELLDQVKICDPAIGSGAFPIGLLQEIYWIKFALDMTLDPAETKLKIIQNAIYGVDLDAGAVEIARLRFWLALIVDEDEPRPLPNLDYKIMQGDSLLESFEGIPLDRLHSPEGEETPIVPLGHQSNLGFAGSQPLLKSKAKAVEISGLIRDYFGETDPARKSALHQRIDRFVLDHLEYNLQLAEEALHRELKPLVTDIARKKFELKGWTPPKKIAAKVDQLNRDRKDIARKKAKLRELEEKPERPYFLWHLFFQDIFEQGGFDIVIANPPYVRQETIKAQKPQLEQAFGDFYCGTADLYTYFYKLGLDKLKNGGHLCFIAPNKFMRAGYGRNTRVLLTREAIPKVVLDFGDLPIFDATTYPSILLVEKKASGVDEGEPARFLTATFTEAAQLERLEETIAAVGFGMPVSALRPEGWALERPETLALMAKLRATGVPLGEYVGGKFYYGIKTGLNEAFVIDEATRKRLIAEDPKSADLIKSWLRGRDIKKWKAEWAGLYVIAIASSGNRKWSWSEEKAETSARALFRKEYPAVHRHLSQWEDKLRARDDQGKFWWELRSCVYWDEFDRPKIVYPDIAHHSKFTWDESRAFIGNTAYIIPTDEDWLVGLLNSSLTWWLYLNVSSMIQGGFVRFIAQYMGQLPIPVGDEYQKAPIIEKVRKVLADPHSPDVPRLEAEIDRLVYDLYGLTEDEIALIESSVAGKGRPDVPDRKSALFGRILPALKEQTAYISIDAIRRALTTAGIELADDTLREYMSEAMSKGVVSDAGRGWYSRHAEPVFLDP
ncbi:Eco57I restriction-modification methylase domain-containing protein, partial [bacterium]|nr:Eco57I restriction-modification methylase domain-containing protein [bacterium]